MANDISGVGLIVNLIADKTFPVGLPISQFADDADPLDFPAIQLADTAMGLNGDLIKWAKAQPIPMVLNVIPGSSDDVNLQILADNNRVGQGKKTSGDVITATIAYPDGSIVIVSGGLITNGQVAPGVSSSGRKKTKAYSFTFQSKT